MIVEPIHRYIEKAIRSHGHNSLRMMAEYSTDELRAAAKQIGMTVTEHDAVILPFRHPTVLWCDIVQSLPDHLLERLMLDFQAVIPDRRDTYRTKKALVRGYLHRARLDLQDLLEDY